MIGILINIWNLLHGMVDTRRRQITIVIIALSIERSIFFNISLIMSLKINIINIIIERLVGKLRFQFISSYQHTQHSLINMNLLIVMET